MIGTMLGNRYELLEKIGEGGMAEVYKAKCHLLNRFVAIKILKSQYSDNTDFLKKFKQEASAAASLSHNNIVGIYDIGSENNINYIVMEYVDGKTLKQIINEKKVLKTEEAIAIAMQIARALECAHNNNIIHRDVKPHNILVTKDGIIKVTDFGIAKATSSVTITNSDRIIGSAHYFSPEQAKGSVVDCRTDIYSLGIVMYEMVTGKVPYDAESPVSVALKHIQEKVVPPKDINEKIPESLNKLILKAIEKEPYKRYNTAKELFIDLDKIKKNPETEIITQDEEKEYTRVMKPINVPVNNHENELDNENLKKYNENEYEEEYDDEQDDDERENKGKNKYSRGKSRLNRKIKKSITMGLIILAIAIVGFTSFYFISKKIMNSKQVTIPNIIGLNKEEAKNKIEKVGLKFVPISESSDKPKDIVIKCYPKEGTKVDTSKQSEVRVIVSSGPKALSMPNLIGVEFETAKQNLSMYKLKLGQVTYEYNDIEKGYVCGQSPEANEKIEDNNTVDLVVSKGPKVNYSKVPSLVGKNFDEAAEMLQGVNLRLGAITKVDTTKEELDGKVVSQGIEPNTEVKENTKVDISYYSYNNKELVVVPDFTGKSISEARDIAKEYNLNIQVKGKDDFVVISQSIPAGKEVFEDTTINLKSEPNP